MSLQTVPDMGIIGASIGAESNPHF
jgi:hypothetical protein